MSFTDTNRPIYYSEDNDYSLHYQNEFYQYTNPTFSTSIQAYSSSQTKKPAALPTISYLNERKCPIYIHHLRNDSSVYNNYNSKLTTKRKNVESPKVTPQNASKFVLDKLEETYWATWKPKKGDLPVKKKSPRNVPDFQLSNSKPVFRVHNKGSKKTSNKPHGDVNDNILKYFRSKGFESSSTGASLTQKNKKSDSSSTTVSDINENKRLTRHRKFEKLSQRDSVSQEIQTEVHCPVILKQIEENNEENENLQVIFEKEEQAPKEKVELVKNTNNENTSKVTKKESKVQKQEEKKNKREGKNKQDEKNKHLPKNNKKSKKEDKIEEIDSSEVPNSTETVENSESQNTFAELKDSVELTKNKQEKSSPKEHYQQPKCIRLYRKSGTSGYIKGGTYPLKSCLKKDSFPKANFRLGAPGSPLFVTASSFSNRRKK